MSAPICMWSGPRNLSTALMRSFGARADTYVWDEPFFAPFLKVTGKDHPGRAETLAAHETDAAVVAKACLDPAPDNAAYYFQKHMPHHMLDGFEVDWPQATKHFFLIRHPARVIASYIKGRADFDLDDLGYGAQAALHDKLSQAGVAPPVVDCDDILAAPRAVLVKLCAALGIAFDEAMLSWPAGPRATDGAWAPYWYGSVERSTGFGPPPINTASIPPDYQVIYASCLADYQRLHARRLV